MFKISAVIIAKNESARIERTLRSYSWCDEIIVVDSGSTDNTVELCEAHGCRVLYNPFENYGKQKEFAISQAHYDWVLSVDADEVTTPKLAKEIQQKLSQNKITFDGYYVPVRHVFMGKIFRYGKESRKYHLRLVRRSSTSLINPDLHEKIQIAGTAGRLRNYLLHYSYDDLEHYFEKFNIYTSKAAIEMSHYKITVNRFLIFLRFPADFIKFYFLHFNFLNGHAGLVWSWLCSIYPLVKYAKTHELLKTIKK